MVIWEEGGLSCVRAAFRGASAASVVVDRSKLMGTLVLVSLPTGSPGGGGVSGVHPGLLNPTGWGWALSSPTRLSQYTDLFWKPRTSSLPGTQLCAVLQTAGNTGVFEVTHVVVAPRVWLGGCGRDLRF